MVLCVALSEESHKGEYVSDLLDKVLTSWEVNKKTFAAVTDNGANFVKGASICESVSES